MRPSTCIGVVAGVLALACSAPPAVTARSPTAPQVAFGSHLYPKPYGLTYVFGQLQVPATTPKSAVVGQAVVIYRSTFPFSAWTAVATVTSDWQGYFSYHERIAQNTAFRAIWQSSPPVQSAQTLIKLPLRLTLRVRHAAGRRLTFSGVSSPAHPGGRVYLQKLGAGGRFRTVARATLGSSSSFRYRSRLRGPGVFRALFAGDRRFAAGASRAIRVAG